MTTVEPSRSEKTAASDGRIPVSGATGTSDGAAPETAARDGRLRGAVRALARPVPAAVLSAAVLHLLWFVFLANSGGDLAAQDAWTEFVARYPDSAYNLTWYGGMHPASYSVFSPYLMVALGVRTTMMIAGTVSAGLLALILVRSRAVPHPLAASLYGVVALTCNAISGRVTYGLGQMFALAAVAAVFAWPARWRTRRRSHRLPRAALVALLAGLATVSSPVAALFLWVVAGALFLSRRRPAAYALALAPAAVIGASALLFPFSGTQPMTFASAALPLLLALAVFVLAPRKPVDWRTVRLGAAVYAAGVLATAAIDSQVGTNVVRLAMIFSGVVLIALLPLYPARSKQWWGALAALLTVTVWHGFKTVDDIVHTAPAASWARELAPLVDQLERRDTDRGRVEVVPARSHRESSALSPYVHLARGWNRQADVGRNPLFYKGTLDATTYRQWLDRWAVRYVVLPVGAEPDGSAREEARLVASGLPYLDEVWSDSHWRLYQVKNPTPLAAPGAEAVREGSAQVTVTVKKAGPVVVRVPYSPWLGLVDERGKGVEAPRPGERGGPAVNRYGCLTKADPSPDRATAERERLPVDEWTVLHAPRAGTYRLAAPYQLPRGTACPEGVR